MAWSSYFPPGTRFSHGVISMGYATLPISRFHTTSFIERVAMRGSRLSTANINGRSSKSIRFQSCARVVSEKNGSSRVMNFFVRTTKNNMISTMQKRVISAPNFVV